ncbi:MOSC N-terminal beta barrel domain-containing protein [Marinicella sp. S1101]|uniref:MOSC domain-containing protein n=1 Tax=Marinicella marina TaxID=2996016 RepID=UPI0022608D7D|nr:MOSC N-terminal beta barrel domain-containing protein [Marinicella marina]MCX7552424.1 MOSC N-terminal beta barrel domain-containing protein [Marinicella marina]MDJ1139299.1 MOSC N-terminal beta barrel domain-containing protein [Marinicella marina]
MHAIITQLNTYPIKSCAAISHQNIVVNEMGLAGDRQYMVVDEDGVFLSQRKHPEMALIKPELTATNLSLSAPGMPNITVSAADSNATKTVTVWKDSLQAHLVDNDLSQWLSTYLKQTVALVHYGTESQRPIDSAYAIQGETVAFADGYPILVTHEASLADLNQLLPKAVGMDRFRANVVVKTEQAPWAEMQWQSISTESFQADLVKPCTRCVMTGVDQQKGQQTGSTVLKTLANERPQNGQAIFGINAIPNIHNGQNMQLSVGQSVQVIQKNTTENQL